MGRPLSEPGIRQRLAAILAADVAGYSRLMTSEERETIAALDAGRSVFRSRIESHQGRVVDMAGDSVLAVFETAIGAVKAALEVQETLDASDAKVPDDRRMRFRIGVHVGDVIEKADGTIYGDGVNVAARLQALAEPGGLTISGAAQEAVRNRLDATLDDLGEQRVKNIPYPVRVFRVHVDRSAVMPPTQPVAQVQPPPAGNPTRERRRWWLWMSAGILVVGALVAADAAWRWHTAPRPLSIDEEIMARRATAVLAFSDKRGTAAGSSIGDDLADAIGAHLLQGGVRVIGRAATVSQDPAAPEFERIGREQGVRFVLGGRITRHSDSMRVNAYLTEVASGAVYMLHEAEFKSDEDAMRSSYGSAVLMALRARYSEIETARARLPGRETDPVDVVALARRDLDRGSTKEDLESARGRFESAAKADPSSVEASLGVGQAHLLQFYYFHSDSPREKLDLAEKELKHALDLGPDNPQILAAWAEILFLRQRPDEAFWMWRKALELSPDFQNAHLRLADALVKQGRFAEAQQHISKVADLRPYQMRRQPGLMQVLADSAFAQGRDDEAYEVLRNWTAEFPDNGRPYLMLAAIDALHGRDAAAAAGMAKVRQLLPLSNIAYVVLTYPSTDPNFLAQRARLVDGLRKAGLPEGL